MIDEIAANVLIWRAGIVTMTGAKTTTEETTMQKTSESGVDTNTIAFGTEVKI